MIIQSLNITEHTEKVGNTVHYVYTWNDCPGEILAICTNKMRSKSKLGLLALAQWQSDLRQYATTKDLIYKH